MKYNIDRINSPYAFNYVNVTIMNNSTNDITMENHFDMYDSGWRSWYTQDKNRVTVPAKATITVMYRGTTGVLLSNEIERLSPTYIINGEKVYPVYDIAKQVWEYE